MERTQDLKELNSVDFTQTANPIMVSVGRAHARARCIGLGIADGLACMMQVLGFKSKVRCVRVLQLRARLRADRMALVRQGAASAKALTWIVSFKGDTARQAWR